MKIPSKKILKFSFKNQLFVFFIFFYNFIFWKLCFLHDEIIFCVRIFFCDQVCICTNPRNHLEHLPCSHGDSEPPAVHILDQFLLGFSGFCEFLADRWSPNPPRKIIKTKRSVTNFLYNFFIGVNLGFQHAKLDFGICGSGSAIL